MFKEVENFVMKNTYAQVARACFYRSPTIFDIHGHDESLASSRIRLLVMSKKSYRVYEMNRSKKSSHNNKRPKRLLNEFRPLVCLPLILSMN